MLMIWLEGFGAFLLLAIIAFWFIWPVTKDRWLYGSKTMIVTLFVSLFVICFVLSICLVGELFKDNVVIVNWNDNPGNGEDVKIENRWAIISQFMDPGNLPAARGKGGRIIAILCALSGIICLSGLFVSSIVNFLSRRSQNWRNGMIRYNRGLRKYVVIIGCNKQTANIVKLSLKRPDVRHVLIQTRQDVDKMRMRLELDLDRKEEKKLVFYYGERTSREDIEALHLEKALDIFVLGEDTDATNEEDHDLFNICCIEHISEHLKKDDTKEKKKVHVNFEYQSTFTAFKSTHIYKSLDKNVEFLPFNIHEIWAKKILIDNFAVIPGGKKGEVKVQNYIPIDSINGIGANDDKTVHLIIVGMNQMGTALGVQTALLAHFPNAHRNRELRTTITFIDDQAEKEGEFFRGRFATMFDLCRYRELDVEKDGYDKEWFDPMVNGRYKHLGENFMDIQWEFIQGNVASDKVRKYLTDISEDKSKITTIAICFNHPQRSVAAALYLPEMVYRRAMQILVYQQNSFDLANKVSVGEKVWKRYKKLRPFGMIEGSYTVDAFDNSMAKILHYLYANHKIGNKNHKDGNQEVVYEFPEIPDMSTYERIDVKFARKINYLWSQQGIVDKLSNIDMVDSIPMKLRSLGVSIDKMETFEQKLCEENVLELMAKAEHSRWVTERVFMNYRPLDDVDAEWKLFAGEGMDDKKRKKEKSYRKEKSRAHLDICSNTTLNQVDPGVHYNDIDVICHIPQLLKYREWINVMKLADEKARKSIAGKSLIDFVIANDNKENVFAFKPIQNGDKCFWIMETSVSQKQWKSIMGSNPADDEGSEKKTKYIGEKLPAVNVSKNDIDDFLKVLGKMTGLRFDLPTFEEWEFAAKQSFDEITSKEHAEDVFRINSSKRADKHIDGPWETTAKKIKQENSLGVYNMLGNVWEWTKTEEPHNSGCYYFCGGSWRFRKLHIDMTKDYWYSFWKPILKSDDVGFRLVWRFDVSGLENGMIEGIKEQLDEVARHSIIAKEETSKEAVERLINMIPVETGYFVMGTENKVDKGTRYPENWIDSQAQIEETPHHFVKISKFQISDTPVTQELWNAVMGIEAKENPSDNIGDNLPQTNVSWTMIKHVFLPKLNEITEKNYRLPTEAEWEYVAKEGHKSVISKTLAEIFENEQKTVEEKNDAVYKYLEKAPKYPLYSGTDVPSDLDLHIIHATTIGVKDRIPNGLGVYDMSGNIWEWCEDFYQTDFYNDCVQGKGDIKAQGKDKEYAENGYITDPVCKDKSYAAHTFRGGSFRFDAKNCRNTSVNFWIDTDTDDDLGFRLALSENCQK